MTGDGNGGEMISAIKKSAAKHPNSEKFSLEVIDEVFSILQKNQYKINNLTFQNTSRVHHKCEN